MVAYEFDAELYLWESGAASWVFLDLPHEIADEIDEGPGEPRGFGSVRVEVTVGSTTWRTSVFPSKKQATYVLPVKRAVRRAEELEVGDLVTVGLTVLA